jgi:hypothetical protein
MGSLPLVPGVMDPPAFSLCTVVKWLRMEKCCFMSVASTSSITTCRQHHMRAYHTSATDDDTPSNVLCPAQTQHTGPVLCRFAHHLRKPTCLMSTLPYITCVHFHPADLLHTIRTPTEPTDAPCAACQTPTWACDTQTHTPACA